jgi:hypothetical protein
LSCQLYSCIAVELYSCFRLQQCEQAVDAGAGDGDATFKLGVGFVVEQANSAGDLELRVEL